MAKKEIKPNDLNAKAKELLQLAQESGVEQNFFFITTFRRYQVQINILSNLEKEIAKGETLITKEYVKGRKNVYTNPVITEYNKTCTSANQTIQTLLKIITTLAEHSITDGIKEDEEL